MKYCGWCNKELPHSSFGPHKRSADGLNYQCKKCRADYENKRRRAQGLLEKAKSKIEGNQKLCMHCKKMKPLSQFSTSSRGLGGVHAYCKPCFADRYRDKDKAKEATASYRNRHKERWRSGHRLHQFKRKSQIRVSSDGSVTDEFLASLYANPVCAYCNRNIPPKDRTADHVVPLSRGGPHAAENLVMACNSCNSSKSDMTAEEFRSSIKCPTMSKSSPTPLGPMEQESQLFS